MEAQRCAFVSCDLDGEWLGSHPDFFAPGRGTYCAEEWVGG
jgi:hypothetical protein